MKDLTNMSINELIDYQKQIRDSIKNNLESFEKRDSNISSYGNSINVDYNGEGAEYSELNRINMEIEKELEKRNK